MARAVPRKGKDLRLNHPVKPFEGSKAAWSEPGAVISPGPNQKQIKATRTPTERNAVLNYGLLLAALPPASKRVAVFQDESGRRFEHLICSLKVLPGSYGVIADLVRNLDPIQQAHALINLWTRR